MHDTGCLGLVHWDDPEGWYGEGGGFRMGNTCIPVVDSFWYMAKPIQYCKVKKLKKEKKSILHTKSCKNIYIYIYIFIVLLYVIDKNHKVIQMFEDILLSQVSIFNLMSTQGIFLLTQYSWYQLWVPKIWIPAIGRACYSTNLAFCRVSFLEMATHFDVLAWRIPRKGEPGGLLSMGSHRVRHDWSDLAVAAAAYIYMLRRVSALRMTIMNQSSHVTILR